MSVHPEGSVTAPPLFKLSDATITSPATRLAGLGIAKVRVAPGGTSVETERRVTVPAALAAPGMTTPFMTTIVVSDQIASQTRKRSFKRSARKLTSPPSLQRRPRVS
ncbi:MAG TPA: hypothetical protein VIP07_04490 [Candidatus Limnocylindria bacterium]|jgi:hypothetical protein